MDQPKRTFLSSVGHYHPDHVIGSDFFDELDIGSDATWVADRTGITSRRSVLSKEDLLHLRHKRKSLNDLRSEGRVMSIADMSAKAWTLLKSRDSRSWRNPDAIICGTSVPDFDIPANACTIAAKIGVECIAMDVNSACSSFVVNLHVARSLLQSGANKKIGIFNPERYSLRLDYSDRSSCVLFGDGSSAACLESESTDNKNQGFELLDTLVVSSPSKFEMVQIPVNGSFSQIGKAVQKFAITRTIEVTEEILHRNGMTTANLAYLIGHQANLRMLTAAVAKLGITPERHLYNVDEFGNQGAAGAPSVLSMNWDKFKSGDLLILSVVGSGLTWASALLRKV